MAQLGESKDLLWTARAKKEDISGSWRCPLIIVSFSQELLFHRLKRLNGIDLIRRGDAVVIGIEEASPHADVLAVLQFVKAIVFKQCDAAAVGIRFVDRSVAQSPAFAKVGPLKLAGQTVIILAMIEARVGRGIDKRSPARRLFAGDWLGWRILGPDETDTARLASRSR